MRLYLCWPDWGYPQRGLPDLPGATPPQPDPQPPSEPFPFYRPHFRNLCDDGCAPFWVSTRSYTARCSDDRLGGSVTKTMQGRSTISQEDADAVALANAKAAAEAELFCYFEATQCVQSPCTPVIALVSDQEGAVITVEWQTEPKIIPQVGKPILIGDQGFFVAAFDEPDQITLDPEPGGIITEGTEVSYSPVICATKRSVISQEDARVRALEAARAQVANLCAYGDLLPIGSQFL